MDQLSNYPPSPEFQRPPAVEALPALLGFAETEELRLLHEQIINVYSRDRETAQEFMTQYQYTARSHVDDAEDPYATQLGLLLQVAVIKRETGRMWAYLEDIEDALSMAARLPSPKVRYIVEQEIGRTYAILVEQLLISDY
jgi:hypothetical protein